MTNLQPGVFAQEHSGSFFVFGILLPKWNELHDAFCFHFCPFVSLFNFFFKAVQVPNEQSAKQIDDDSCGVFCLSFLDSIIRGMSISGLPLKQS